MDDRYSLVGALSIIQSSVRWHMAMAMGMLAIAQGDRGVGIVVRSLASDSATTLQDPKSEVQVRGQEPPQLSRSVHWNPKEVNRKTKARKEV